MATSKLTGEQRATLLEWLAADYDYKLIQRWFDERGWPQVSRNTISYYRKARDISVQKLRSERRAKALTKGLALKEERVIRLAKHADELAAIMWEPDKNGRYPLLREWRETLGDLAAEMGHRKLPVEFSWEEKLIAPIKEGKLNYAEVESEFGEVTAKRLFESAGVSVIEGREIATPGAEERDTGGGGNA